MQPNESNKPGADGPKPDFSKMSGDELEKYLEAAAERMRQEIVERLRRNGVPLNKGLKIEVFWIQGCGIFVGTNLESGEALPIPINEIPESILFKHHNLLVQEVTRLKKAWLMVVAIFGKHFFNISDINEYLPHIDYSQKDRKWLKREAEYLRDDFDAVAASLLVQWNAENRLTTSSWLAEQFDRCIAAVPKATCIGRVGEIECAIGTLGLRRHMDCPPYAQVMFQGFEEGAGIRHPEYHLASDMALLYNLFLDSEQLGTHFEHSQSLGRNVILTCFNLLEAFITGLAATFVWENPNAPRDAIQQLKGFGADGRYLNLRLDEKFEGYPALIAGKSGWSINQPPFEDLFARVKSQRNAMTHPSMPFQPADKARIQNESRFHDITLDGVREIVGLTGDAICRVWQFVHGKPKPSWLRLRQEDGRFPHVKFKLAPNGGE